MALKAIIYVPFFYFQQSRLKSLKDYVFHFVYEWFPAMAILVLQKLEGEVVMLFAINYLAFISLYEIGYLFNDQLAHSEVEGRKRFSQLSRGSIALFLIIRIAVFVGVTFYTDNQFNVVWYSWYLLLLIVFSIHNLLRSSTLKCITFSYLAFVRFLSPIFFILPFQVSFQLFVPILMNYVLFRLFGYMDSKNLLTAFDRKSNNFRVGFYFLIVPFSIVTSFVCGSLIPMLVNAYYLAAACLFAMMVNRLPTK
jgi:hypothetical protein